jgi:hypothetical protein
MGCAASSSTAVNSPVIKPKLRRIGNFTFSQHGELHTDNILTGKGCKKCPGWSTTASKEEVTARITEYWETRISGNPEAWRLLQLACSVESAEAEAICQAGGLRLINGTLLTTQDDAGYIYEVPPFAINPALEYGTIAHPDKSSAPIGPSRKLRVKLRSNNFADIELDCTSLTSGLELKDHFATKYSLQITKLRCFYSGRELKDDLRFGTVGVKDGDTITVMCLS